MISRSAEFHGTVHGEAARAYAGYTYRKPLMSPVNIWQLDPERVRPTHEYPRSVNPPSPPNIRVVELADYVVRIGATDSYGMKPLQVWMQPNEYTAARQRRLVCEVRVSGALRREWREEVEWLAFRDVALREKRGAKPLP